MFSEVVTRYVDEALAQQRRRGGMMSPGKLPEAMRDRSIPPANDWIGWKAIPTTISDADLDALEREAGLEFPPLYRDFLRYRHFVELTETGVRFERHISDEWQATLRELYSYSRKYMLDVGLLPFGSECYMDAGQACFDTRFRLPDGDCPVVFWDHEWVGTPKEIGALFSSSRKMFECLYMFAANDLNFIYHDPTYDDDALLPRKRELLAQFLAIDPEGAGGPARDYWTAWGL